MIRLEDIDAGNWRIPLSVSKDQEQYVASTTTILARAYAYREQRSRAFVIYDNETPVGMVLYHDEDSLDAYIFIPIQEIRRYCDSIQRHFVIVTAMMKLPSISGIHLQDC